MKTIKNCPVIFFDKLNFPNEALFVKDGEATWYPRQESNFNIPVKRENRAVCPTIHCSLPFNGASTANFAH